MTHHNRDAMKAHFRTVVIMYFRGADLLCAHTRQLSCNVVWLCSMQHGVPYAVELDGTLGSILSTPTSVGLSICSSCCT